MGIVNVTPDSFHDGGRHDSAAHCRQRGGSVMEMTETFVFWKYLHVMMFVGWVGCDQRRGRFGLNIHLGI